MFPALLMAMSMAATAWATPGAEEPDYFRDVKPILKERCYACHGPLRRKAGLRLDTAALIHQGGDSGPAVEPGLADESVLIDRLIDEDDSFRMPPESQPLSAEQIALVRAWINAGAPIPEGEEPQEDPRTHWAFRPPVRPDLPDLSDTDGVRNPVDAFLAADFERLGLKPSPEADRETLLRRLSLDLTGLAPTLEQHRDFLADDSPHAFEDLVDRLLASPSYGERWGRHWMDVWRYSDWYGYRDEVRHSQPFIWRWRDWIVESLNQGKGYDRMVVEMLAADEVAPDDPDTLRANGYLVRNWFKFNRDVWLQDTVDHTAKAFLGITLNCARCHDHMFDPIRQEDYYRFRAFFEPHEVRTDGVPEQADTTKDGLVRVYDAYDDRPTYLFTRGNEAMPQTDRPLEPALSAILGDLPEIKPIDLPPKAYYPGLQAVVRSELIAKADAEVANAQRSLDEAFQTLNEAAEPVRGRAELAHKVATQALSAANAERESLRARIAADDARYLADPPDPKHAESQAIRAARAERRAKAVRTSLALAEQKLALSDLEKLAEQGDDQAAEGLPQARESVETLRQTLIQAEAEANALTQEYSPIVPMFPKTSTGRRLALARWITSRENPTSARVVVNHVWLRHFGEPLVGSVFDFGNHGQGPSNPALLDWLAFEFMEQGWSLKHLQRLIVTSQAYRMRSNASTDDPNLAIDPSNRSFWRMNPKRMEAELVRDNLLWISGDLDPSMGGPELDETTALTSNRRSLYYRHTPEKQAELLKTFNAANANSCYRRDVSIVPQQALALANSTLSLAKSRRLASRISEQTGSDDAQFIKTAFLRVLGRQPLEAEQSACASFLDKQAERLADPESLTTIEDGPPCDVPPAVEPRQRAREGLIHALFNHNDFVMIR